MLQLVVVGSVLRLPYTASWISNALHALVQLKTTLNSSEIGCVCYVGSCSSFPSSFQIFSTPWSSDDLCITSRTPAEVNTDSLSEQSLADEAKGSISRTIRVVEICVVRRTIWAPTSRRIASRCPNFQASIRPPATQTAIRLAFSTPRMARCLASELNKV